MNHTGSRDEYLQCIDSANAIDDVIRNQRVFERADEYAKSLVEPQQIISPRLVTAKVTRMSEETLRQCDEIVARNKWILNNET